MNDIVAFREAHQLTAGDMRAHVNLVQEVMKAVMKPNTHYGVIPGTKKPTLYKAGAEVLCATFRIADKYEIDDLSVDGMARVRVRCVGTHQLTGTVLGEGVGECSSHEEKYKWRAAVCDEEFEETPPNMRRVKYSKYNGKVEKKKQVRTEQADGANTVTKMACKRAKIAMTLNVTAASDIFTQDIEDLPDELRTQEGDDQGGEQRDAAKEKTPQPYHDDQFKKNLPAWTKLIQSGKRSADDIIKTVSSKAVLSDEQKKQIKAVKVAPTEVTYAQVEEKLRNAKAKDELDVAADLIKEVKDEMQRDELDSLYLELAAKYEQ